MSEAKSCPRCGGAIDTGDKQCGTRLTCPHCRSRPYLLHRLPLGVNCEPLCSSDRHWYLSMSGKRLGALRDQKGGE